MAYKKQSFANNQTLKAEQLKAMDDGIFRNDYLIDILKKEVGGVEDDLQTLSASGYNPADIKEAVEAYLTANPPSSVQSAFPVGSIHISTRSANPADYFGFGTWSQIKDMFLLGCGDTYSAGTTGGEATHALTVDEIPKHSHGDYPAGAIRASIEGTDWTYQPIDATAKTGATDSAGGGVEHNNMPPYLAVYIWERTA